MRKRIGNLDCDRASHCVYHPAVHVVCCTKGRKHTLTSEAGPFRRSQYGADRRRNTIANNSSNGNW